MVLAPSLVLAEYVERGLAHCHPSDPNAVLETSGTDERLAPNPERVVTVVLDGYLDGLTDR
ncbi:MAG: hypothetical protein GW880_07675 [Armatimonadetes bacterium]|nr:hypothetical protein [Armatimonadota bacterium]NCP32126.1 hypothetical protein [Armatimonadota bacterium]